MGGHYGSVQVRSENRDRVKEAAEQVARASGIHCLVAPVLNGWIGIYPEDNGQDQTIGQQISQQLPDDHVLHLLVHDDDIFAYWLYRAGNQIDAYWSTPGYFGEENRAQEETMIGNPETFRPIIGDKVSRLVPLLARDAAPPTFASDRLAEFAKVLNIPNAVTAYEYLKEGEATGVKGRRQFEEVPAQQVSAERDDKRRQRNLLQAERKRLQSAGLLLLRDERKEQLPYGCAVRGGFVVAWPDHRRGTVSFNFYREPWTKPEPLELNVPTHVTALATDAAHQRLAIAAGNVVRIWDLAGEAWNHVADIPESDLAIGIAISGDGSRVAHASREEMVITEVSTNRKLLSLPSHGDYHMAFHPSGDWLAASGNSFGLVSLSEPRHWRDLYVGGKSNLVPDFGALMQSKMRDVDMQALEKQYRATIDATIAKMQSLSGRSKKHAISDEQVEAMRRDMEANLQKSMSLLTGMSKGALPAAPPQANERVNCVGFTRDGQWLLCGTQRGLRVYDWSTVPRTPGSDMPAPRWTFESPGSTTYNVSTYIYAIAEEPNARAIVFAGGSGRIHRLDLNTGDTRELIALPANPAIYNLAFSPDGKTLATASHTLPTAHRAQSAKDQRYTWQIWSYPNLVQSHPAPFPRLTF